MSELSAEIGKTAADLPQPEWRKETFLARYPRKVKCAAAVLLALLVLALCFLSGSPDKKASSAANQQDAKKTIHIESADRLQKGPDAPPPSAAATATSLNEQDDRTVKLAQAPNPDLVEDTASGGLPRISASGEQPWQAYARPFNTADKRPRIGLVISGLGLSRSITDAAINRLPVTVTLAFDVEGPTVAAWLGRARQEGHETLLSIPMEPFDYPRSDPGPNTLLTTITNSDNIERLMGMLRQGSGYVGITTLSGSRFTTDPEKLRPILEALRKRGLMIFDARVAPHSVVMDMSHDIHLPAVDTTQTIGDDLTPQTIDGALNQLEKSAQVNGRAIAVLPPEPIVFDRLQIWLKDLPARGFALAPISALVQ